MESIFEFFADYGIFAILLVAVGLGFWKLLMRFFKMIDSRVKSEEKHSQDLLEVNRLTRDSLDRMQRTLETILQALMQGRQ